MERKNHPTDQKSLERDCQVEFYVASGPGGQHRNRNRTGVRLRHLPSGIVVTATERRSQRRNLEAAYERLAKRLQVLNQPKKKRKPTRPSKASRKRRLESKSRRSEKKRLRQKPKVSD